LDPTFKGHTPVVQTAPVAMGPTPHTGALQQLLAEPQDEQELQPCPRPQPRPRASAPPGFASIINPVMLKTKNKLRIIHSFGLEIQLRYAVERTPAS
jgi:hypothetical protein